MGRYDVAKWLGQGKHGEHNRGKKNYGSSSLLTYHQRRS